jgi:hypothetical protein
MMYLHLVLIGLWTYVASGYQMIPMLSDSQTGLISKIFKEGDENQKARVRAIVAHHYTPWVKRFCGDFAKKHRVMGDKVLVNELHQSGYLGFMESLENYNGAVKIPYYSGKYIHGRLCKVMKLRGQLRTYDLVSYAHRWKFNGIVLESDENLVSTIKAIILNAPEEYQKWFFERYDYQTLKPRDLVKDVCNRMNCSHETYRLKMKKINEYVLENMGAY